MLNDAASSADLVAMLLRKICRTIGDRLKRARAERGALLVVMVGAVVALLACAALALDTASRTTDAQRLQNAADSAALAGVVSWVDTGDEAQATAAVNELLTQNGATSGGDVTVDVQFPSPNTIRVTATDNSPTAFLMGAIGVANQGIERAASASFESCANPCGGVIEIPPPFLSINALGSGDGWVPTIVGTRLYGVNHHETTMACVDRITQLPCFVNLELFPSGQDYETDDMVTEGVVGSRIYYLGQNDDDITLFCWETTTDLPCLQSFTLADLPGNKFRGGALSVVNDKVYVVTDDHRMHCIEPATQMRCVSYPNNGHLTGLGGWIDPIEDGDALGNQDRVVDGSTGRIYYTMKAKKDRDGYDEGTYIDCWDTIFDVPCAEFPPAFVSDWADKKSGRLFLYHHPRVIPTSAAQVGGVCSTDDDEITCFDLNGIQQAWMSDEMSSLESDMDKGGVHLYHPPSNRLVLQAKNLNLCWDFDAKVRCGSLNAAPTKDYGFTYEGDCIFALGHNSMFWSFNSDFDAGCPGTSTTARLDKCECAGVDRWPDISFEFPTHPFTKLDLTIQDPAGNTVWPEDGLPYSALITGNEPISIDEVSTAHPYLTLLVVITLDPTFPDPWDSPDPPEVTLQRGSLPHLTD